MMRSISLKGAAATARSDAVFFKGDVINRSKEFNVYLICVTFPLEIECITEQPAEEEQQQLELEQGAKMNLAMQMRDLHVLEHGNVGIVEAVLRNVWAKWETISDNARETQAWNFVWQLELSTNILSCRACKPNNAQPVCNSMRTVFSLLGTGHLRKQLDGKQFAMLANVRPNFQSLITHLVMSLRNRRAANAESPFTASCGCELQCRTTRLLHHPRNQRRHH